MKTVILWRGARLDWAQKLRHRWRARHYYQTQVLRKLKKRCESYVTESPETRPVIDLVQAVPIILRLCRASVTAIIGSVTWKRLKKNEGVPSDSCTVRSSSNAAWLQQNYSITHPQIFAVHSIGISHFSSSQLRAWIYGLYAVWDASPCFHSQQEDQLSRRACFPPLIHVKSLLNRSFRDCSGFSPHEDNKHD
jgi:hypothetical protein